MTISARKETASPAPSITLADVEHALRGVHGVTDKQRRDYRSAVTRVAKIYGDDPANVPLDFPAIRAKLDPISPVGAGISPKTYANIRSNFVRGVRASGLKPVRVGGRGVRLRSAEWIAFRTHLKDRRLSTVVGE